MTLKQNQPPLLSEKLQILIFTATNKRLHSAIRVMHGQNHDIHGNMGSRGAGAVCMTDDSCSLHGSHMAAALYVWLYVCSALKSWEFMVKRENVNVAQNFKASDGNKTRDEPIKPRPKHMQGLTKVQFLKGVGKVSVNIWPGATIFHREGIHFEIFWMKQFSSVVQFNDFIKPAALKMMYFIHLWPFFFKIQLVNPK